METYVADLVTTEVQDQEFLNTPINEDLLWNDEDYDWCIDFDDYSQ